MDLPNSGIEPRSLALQADFLPAEPQGKNIENVIKTIKSLDQSVGMIAYRMLHAIAEDHIFSSSTNKQNIHKE